MKEACSVDVLISKDLLPPDPSSRELLIRNSILAPQYRLGFFLQGCANFSAIVQQPNLIFMCFCKKRKKDYFSKYWYFSQKKFISLSQPLYHFIKEIYWKLNVPVLLSWTNVFPRTLNLCREHTTKYSP